MDKSKSQTQGISRRSAIKNIAAGSVVLGALGALSGCGKNPTDPKDEPVQVSEDGGISILEEFSESDDKLDLAYEIDLPNGTILKPSTGSWIPCLCAGEVASRMVTASAVSVASGKLYKVVAETFDKTPSEVISDVSCSDDLFAWVEIDMLTRAWKLYAAPFKDGAIGDVTSLWTAGKDYDPPSICCVGKKVLWQVMPNPNSSKRTEHSFCYVWSLGDKDAKAQVDSPGRFATPISVSAGKVILCPRTQGSKSGINYKIGVYSLEDNLATELDSLVLPSPIKPLYATYINGDFVFSIEANYETKGLFSRMGTYIGKGEGPYYVLSREPYSNVCGSDDGVFVIKNRSSYFVVNIQNKTYSILPAQDRCVDYGEYPASEGVKSVFTTFSTIKDEKTGYPSSVKVRSFTL